MELINPNFIQESKYQLKINNNLTQCLTCERKCKIARTKTGFCNTRMNIEGKIYALVYGCIPALFNNPIEKKPLFHFYPGTYALTAGTYGCNFSCPWCQNHHISHPSSPILDRIKDEKHYISPKRLVELTIKNHSSGTSISFNEPTLLFEYSLDVFKFAKQKGLYNTYVSNGYMTENVLNDLANNGLDAINIDIKGSAEMVQKYCGADVEIVWRNAKIAKELGVHVEITTLLIEKLNTNQNTIKSISKRICEELGEDTPFHITRSFPHYKSHKFGINEPTSIKSLEKSYKIAKNEGLNFVYIGNVNNRECENTICPKCSNLVIRRTEFGVKSLSLDSKGNCKYCGYPICRL
ncbi:MAG: AmmeMemoRadiSam system radical SAM enzyme [Promethearchaeota archaeon]|nr:MAG: AmmeMemoRadiSam system radical SAM enzyme [Candidatus Lokiarchaeota archaeon]